MVTLLRFTDLLKLQSYSEVWMAAAVTVPLSVVPPFAGAAMAGSLGNNRQRAASRLDKAATARGPADRCISKAFLKQPSPEWGEARIGKRRAPGDLQELPPLWLDRRHLLKCHAFFVTLSAVSCQICRTWLTITEDSPAAGGELTPLQRLDPVCGSRRQMSRITISTA
jgi:hypothetical protein